MQHSFNIEIATDVGINAAIIFNNFCFWILHNEKNNLNYHDGKHWVYNSNKALTELFPYLTERQISTAILKLREKQYLVTGNYNENKYDRTLWYAFGEKGKAFTENVSSISQNCKMENTKKENGNPDNVECNKDINKDNIININKDNNIYPQEEINESQPKAILSELKSRINLLYHRRDKTTWTDKETVKLKQIAKRNDVLEELADIERLYNSGYEYRRRDVQTFLNNWTTELDRARNRMDSRNNINSSQYRNYRATNIGEDDYGKDITNGF